MIEMIKKFKEIDDSVDNCVHVGDEDYLFRIQQGNKYLL